LARLSVVGIGGSLARVSSSLAALRIAVEGAADGDVETRVLDLRALTLPMFDPDLTEVPAPVAAFCDTVYAAHGLVWSSPLYNGTISGAFKNALDWLHVLGDRTPPFLTDKIVGLVSTAGGVHGLQAVNTMEFVVRSLRGWAVPLVVPIPRAPAAFDNAGRPHDPQLETQLRQLGHEVARAARQMATHGVCDYFDPLVPVSG